MDLILQSNDRGVEWIKKQGPTTCVLPTRDSLHLKGTHRLKVKGWKNIHANGNPKEEVAIITSDKTDFKSKTPKRLRQSSYNDKGVNSLTGCNNCKYSFT